MTVIHLDHVDKMEKTPAAIMEELLKQYSVPEDKQVGFKDTSEMARVFFSKQNDNFTFYIKRFHKINSLGSIRVRLDP